MQHRRIVKTLNLLAIALLLAGPLLVAPTASAGSCAADEIFIPGTGCVKRSVACVGDSSDPPECSTSGTTSTTTDVETSKPPWWQGRDPNGDHRANANAAEDFAVYCRPPGAVEVWKTTPPPPRQYARFPIGWIIALSPGSGADAGEVQAADMSLFVTDLFRYAPGDEPHPTLARDGDRVTFQSEGRRKDFSLSECLQKAGVNSAARQAALQLPCDRIAIAAAETRVANLQAQLARAQATLDRAQANQDAAFSKIASIQRSLVSAKRGLEIAEVQEQLAESTVGLVQHYGNKEKIADMSEQYLDVADNNTQLARDKVGALARDQVSANQELAQARNTNAEDAAFSRSASIHGQLVSARNKLEIAELQEQWAESQVASAQRTGYGDKEAIADMSEQYLKLAHNNAQLARDKVSALQEALDIPVAEYQRATSELRSAEADFDSYKTGLARAQVTLANFRAACEGQ